MEMRSGEELLSQQGHTVEAEDLFFNLSILRGHRETTVAILKDRLLGKLIVQMNKRTLAVKRINTGALGEPAGDAIPNSRINPSASDIVQNHSPHCNCLANRLSHH